jgi:hypothetical protein
MNRSSAATHQQVITEACPIAHAPPPNRQKAASGRFFFVAASPPASVLHGFRRLLMSKNFTPDAEFTGHFVTRQRKSLF